MRKLSNLMLLLLLYTSGQAQTISSFLCGQNSWMPYSYGSELYYGQLNQLWKKVEGSKVKFIRIGGIAPDFSKPTNAQYIGLIDSIRKIGAEPLVQVSYGRGTYTAQDAANTVNYINNTMSRNIKYWSISNEPNLPTHGYPAVTAAEVETYTKSFASAMKAIDPTILIAGPDAAWYDANYYAALIGGTNDITGKDGTGRYYIDIVTFHTYPFDGTQTRAQVIGYPESGLTANINSLLSAIAAANTKNNRAGNSALKWAITEFNVNYLNPAINNVDGVGVHSFLNGQFWAEYFGLGMKYSALSMMPWSIHESGGARSDYDLGYLDNNTTFDPRSTYYHEMLISEYFSGTYVSSTDNNALTKVYAATNNGLTSVLLMNQELNATQDYILRFNNTAIPTHPGVSINVNAGINKQISDRIGAQSTEVLVFNAAGEMIKRCIYNRDHAVNNQPPVCYEQAPYNTLLTAPCTIQAENFDRGGNSISFHDITQANEGNTTYRTDAVDIEATTDGGGGYNVGWTAANEWLEYTVQIPATGNYRLNFRMASLSGGGTFYIAVNDQDLSGDVAIPTTGGWQAWQTVTAPVVNLNAGTQTIRITIRSGGFNFNYFEIAPESTLDLANYYSKNNSQNSTEEELRFYPNPTENTATLEATFSKASLTQISLYNYMGCELNHWVLPSLQTQLKHELSTEALTPGIYFLELATGDKKYTMKFVKK